jgi:hypothetical protein
MNKEFLIAFTKDLDLCMHQKSYLEANNCKAIQKIEEFFTTNRVRRIGDMKNKISNVKFYDRIEQLNIFADYFIIMFNCLAWLSEDETLLKPTRLRMKFLIKNR